MDISVTALGGVLTENVTSGGILTQSSKLADLWGKVSEQPKETRSGYGDIDQPPVCFSGKPLSKRVAEKPQINQLWYPIGCWATLSQLRSELLHLSELCKLMTQ